MKHGNIPVGDLAAAAFLTAGFSESLFVLLGFDPKAHLTLLFAVPAILLLWGFGRRWWLSPVLVLLPALAVGILLEWLGKLADVLSTVRQFFTWSQTWLQIGQVAPETDTWPILLKLILMLPIALLFLILLSKTKRLVVLLLLILAFFIPVLIAAPNAETGLLLALCGLITQMPKAFVNKLSKRSGQELPGQTTLQMIAAAAALFCLLLTLAVIPSSTSGWRWTGLHNQLTDLGDLVQQEVWPGRTYQPFTLGSYNFRPAGARLGGAVLLQTGNVLEVESASGGLLKGSSYMNYSGSNWLSGNSYQYRLDSALWRSLRQEVFGSDLPAIKAFRKQYAIQRALLVRHQQSGLSTLFSKGRTLSVEPQRYLDEQPYFSSSGDLFIFGQIRIGATYWVETIELDTNAEGFDQALLDIEAAAAAQSDPSWTLVSNQYLQLPESLPEKVWETAEAAVLAADSPYGKALNLQSHFQNGYIYTLTPDDYSASDDFVASFLETKSGYCVHFASAMVVMARKLDIPARYVEGFILVPEDSDSPTSNTYRATGRSAHAWAELYFEGIGWIAFDPTPGNSILDPADPTPTPGPSTSLTPTPPVQIEPTPVPDKPADKNAGTPAVVYWLPALLAVLAIGWKLLPALLIRRHERLFDRSWVKRQRQGTPELLDFYYSDCLRQLACLEIRPDLGETLSEFSDRVERYLKLDGIDANQAFWPVIAWRYGRIRPTMDDIDRIARFHNRLEDRVRDRLRFWAYLFRRVIGFDRSKDS